MNRRIVLLGLMAVLALSLSAASSGAWDTSSYLAGTFTGCDIGNAYFVVNPTTRPLRVYGAGFDYQGSFEACYWTVIPGNGTFYFPAGSCATGQLGNSTMKFFAFPADTLKFDPNAVIGGFQQKFDTKYRNNACQVTEANLKAVVINSSTIGEFEMIKQKNCLPFDINQFQIPQPWPWPMAGACMVFKEPA
jgi:hypothetical protein